MNDTKIIGKDPIKDKYNQKLSFFKKIQIKLINFKNSLKSNKTLTEDADSFFSLVTSVALYGILGGLSLSVFGIPLSFVTFLGAGSLLWLTEHKFIDFITRILGSIKLVDIN